MEQPLNHALPLNQALEQYENVDVPHGPNIDVLLGNHNEFFVPTHLIGGFFDVLMMQAIIDGFTDEALTPEEVQSLYAYDQAVTAIFMAFWNERNPPDQFGWQRLPAIRVWVHRGPIL
jgi:hypothetical protein